MSEQEKPAGATTLVIDDDGRVHAALRTILEHAGHEIIEAYDGGTATQIFQAKHDEIDVVIMDWKMPGLDGHNWITIMLDTDPNAQIMFCTTYEVDEDIRRRLETQVVGFLDKPIDREQLLGFVDKAPAQRRATASGPPGE